MTLLVQWFVVVSTLAQVPDLDDLKVTAVGDVGPTAMRADLVIIGDGYLPEDFGPGRKWEIDCARLVKNFFEKEPFKQLRPLFNVFLVEVPSKSRGADDSPGKDTKDTVLNSSYGTSGIDRLLVCQNEHAAEQAFRNAPAVDLVIVLINDSRFGGSGGSIADVPASCTSTQPTAFLIAIHEFGHSFAGLADEYVDDKVTGTYPLPASGDLAEPNVTLAEFIDTSSRENLIESIKWGHLLDEPNADKLYGKGYFEGGYYRAKGVYRPSQNCIMASESGGGRFCFVCIHEMTKAIYRAAGRGAGGGVFPETAPPMKGRMRSARFAYGIGLFGRLDGELKKVEASKKLEAGIKENVALLRGAVKATLEKSLEKIDDLSSAGEALALEELLGLLRVSFKGTENEERIEARHKEITGAEAFKKEARAGRELLKLDLILRNRSFLSANKAKADKLLDDFLTRHAGTKAAARAKKTYSGGKRAAD